MRYVTNMARKTTNNAEGQVAVEDTDTAASLVAGLADYAGIESIDGDDEDDLVSIAALLGVGVDDADGTDTEDSQSEIEGDTDSDTETDEEADDTDSDDAADEEGANSDDAEGDKADDGDPDAEEANSKPVPKDIRTLRKSHAFRKEIEPVIKDVRNELPEVVGIANALKSDPKNAITAIRGYSESAAAGLEAAILEQKAAEYVASKYGIEAKALETVLKGGEDIEPSKGLKEEIALLTEEGQEELAKLLKKSPIEGERVKTLESRVQQVTEVLQRERVEAMQEKIDDKFAGFVKALKIEGDLSDLQEAMVVKLSKDSAAMAAYNAAATAAAEGRKADGKRLLTDFLKIMADYTKKLPKAGAVEVKETAVAEKKKQVAAKPTAAKAPAVPKPAAPKSKAAVAGSDTARQPSAAETEAQKFARLLKFSKGRAKELGIAWGG